MQQFKHKEGDIIETTAGTYGKVVSAKVVYVVAFSADESHNIDEDVIITPAKEKRTRKKKDSAPAE